MSLNGETKGAQAPFLYKAEFVLIPESIVYFED